MSRVDGNGKNAQQVADALAALFALEFPDTREDAEVELWETGADPVEVGQRFKRLAEIALGEVSIDAPPALGNNRPPLITARDSSAVTRTRASGEPPRTATRPDALRMTGDSARPAGRPRRWSSSRFLGAIAATLVVFGLGYVTGRDRTRGIFGRFEPLPSLAPPAAPFAPGKGRVPDVLADKAGEAHRGHPLQPTPHAGDTPPPPDAPSTGALVVPEAPAGPSEITAPAVERDEVGGSAESVRESMVKSGEVITRDNVESVQNMISPGVEWCIRHGLTMEIVPYRKVRWNAAYREATSQYAEQTKLSPDGRSLVGYVAGLPFPDLDPNDPQIALKIMWNYEYKPYVTDDQEVRNFDADTGPVTGTSPMQVERHFTFERAARLFYTGRVNADPKPELPNPDHVQSKWSLHPFLEPSDLKGVGLTGIRYLSPDRQDDTWLYLPSLRRVRRLSSSQRSDALFGQDMDVDSFGDNFGGFAGQIPWFDWKYLGEKQILASFHAEQFPGKHCAGGGDFTFCDTWENRQVYVIEGVPKLPQYAYGKRVLFIDKETYLIAYSDLYDRSGQLWKVWVNQWSFKKRATPSYGFTYDDQMPFHPSVTMVDMQRNHATRVVLPSAKYPGEEGWYFNLGDKTRITEEFFTIAHLIASGN